jgi:hypothetical protein
MVLSPPRKMSVVSRNRRTMEGGKTLWLAYKVQIERNMNQKITDRKFTEFGWIKLF